MCALRGGIREGPPPGGARNMPNTRSPMAANGGMRSYEDPKTPGKPTRAQRHAVGRTLNAWRWAVKPIPRNDGYGGDSGPFRGNPCTAAFRPLRTIGHPYGAHDNIIAGAGYLCELHDRYPVLRFLSAYDGVCVRRGPPRTA